MASHLFYSAAAEEPGGDGGGGGDGSGGGSGGADRFSSDAMLLPGSNRAGAGGVRLFDVSGRECPAVLTPGAEVAREIARLKHTLAARYNKPEALEIWLEQEGLTGDRAPKTVVFVDDNSDNVFNMYMHFASRELARLQQQAELEGAAAGKREGPALPRGAAVLAVWHPPPPSGRAKTADAGSLAALRALIASGGGEVGRDFAPTERAVGDDEL